jgi:hypothetical protein
VLSGVTEICSALEEASGVKEEELARKDVGEGLQLTICLYTLLMDKIVQITLHL